MYGYQYPPETSIRETKGGGTAIYIKEGIKYTPKITKKQEVVEYRGITVFGVNRKIDAYNCYIPKPTEFSKDDILDQLFTKNSILVGDFNMHHPNWNPPGYPICDPAAVRLLNYANKTNRVILNDGEITRMGEGNQADTNIDLAIVPKHLAHKSNILVHDTTLNSDHFPITLEIEFQVSLELSKTTPRWKTHKADWEAYKTLAETNFHYDSADCDIQDLETKFINSINESATHSIPKTKDSNRKPPRRTVPWWNKECSEAIKNRENARRTYKKRKNENNRAKLVDARKAVKKTIYEAKRNNWRDYVSKITHKTTSKEIWDNINKIRGKNAKQNNPTLEVEGQYFITSQEKANALVNHYQKVSSTNSLPPAFIPVKQKAEPKIDKLLRENGNPDTDPDYNKDFSLFELNHALTQCKNTAPGEDLINYEMIKQLPDIGKIRLLELYNRSWQEGTSPEAWGKAVIIPLLKANKDKTDPASYRPISLTSALTKVMQRMIKARLVPYLETNNLIPNTQSGCRSNRSCEDHLVKLEADIKRAQLDNKYLLAIFLDLSNAFDRCWNKGALLNLLQLGIKGKMLNWLVSFLDNRQISVKVGGETSDTLKTENGCPQGSVLSPIIFNVIMNTLSQTIAKVNRQYEIESKKVNLAQFVDDGAFWLQSGKLKKLTERAQNLLNAIESWSHKWGFTINPLKTQVIIFSKRTLLPIREIAPKQTLMGNQLTYQKVIKFLGVLFDHNLTWRDHIKSLTIRCNKDLNLLRIISGTHWGADKISLMSLFKALILSKINYGSVAFASASKPQIKKLQVIQNKALRLISGAVPGTPADRLHAELACMPVHLQFEQNALNYWARSSTLGNNLPINDYLQDFAVFVDESLAPNIRRPYCHTVRQAIKEFKLDDVQIQKPTFCTLSNIQFTCSPNLTLKNNIDKKTSDPQIMKIQTENFINTYYLDHTKIFTDGSKDTESNTTGSGIVIYDKDNEQIAQSEIKLDPLLSVFTAELAAIHIALKWVYTENAKKCVILSDSLSALQAVENISLNSRPDLISKIMQQYNRLTSEGYQIDLAWIPSHVGVKGNEKADELAKNGASKGQLIELLPSKSEICALIRKRGKDKSKQVICSTLLPENPVINSMPNKIAQYSDNRKTDIGYTRLRLGWGKIRLLQKMNVIHECKSCGIELSVNHIFFDNQEQCPEYTNLRHILHNTLLQLGIPIITEQTLLFPPKLHEITIRSAVLKFLEDTGFINEV